MFSSFDDANGLGQFVMKISSEHCGPSEQVTMFGWVRCIILRDETMKLGKNVGIGATGRYANIGAGAGIHHPQTQLQRVHLKVNQRSLTFVEND
jgi:hypothetical protein